MRRGKGKRTNTTMSVSDGEPTRLNERRAPERLKQRLAANRPLRCALCGVLSRPHAFGWRGYRTDLEEDGDVPTLAFFCPACAELEFES